LHHTSRCDWIEQPDRLAATKKTVLQEVGIDFPKGVSSMPLFFRPIFSVAVLPVFGIDIGGKPRQHWL